MLQVGYKSKKFLLALLASLFCIPILKNGVTARYCDGYLSTLTSKLPRKMEVSKTKTVKSIKTQHECL